MSVEDLAVQNMKELVGQTNLPKQPFRNVAIGANGLLHKLAFPKAQTAAGTLACFTIN